MDASKQIKPKQSEKAEKNLRLRGGNSEDAPPTMPPRLLPKIPKSTGELFRQRQSGQDTRGKELMIGQDISLSGTINRCEKLIIAGTVESEISECRELEIASGGLFKGEAKIQVAEIAGEFVGNLVVELLILRDSGRISGTLTYGQLEIERGGEIIGTITKLEGNEES